MVELFGEPAALFIDICTHYEDMKRGTDYSRSGSFASDDPVLDYFYFTGFLKVVSDHNHRLQVISHRQSEGGKVWDIVLEERFKKIDAEDAKNQAELEAKRQKRRKKKGEAFKATLEGKDIVRPAEAP